MPETQKPLTVAKDPIASIAAQLRDGKADTGLLAALRRHHPVTERRRCLFELHQVLDRAGVDIAPDNVRFDRWALLVHCMALARGAHNPNGNCGGVLAQAHVSEARLRQLVEADSELLAGLLPLLARRLAAGGWSLNWWPLAQLLLNAELDEAKADAARSQLVQGWLRGAANGRIDAAAQPAAEA